MQDVEAEVIRIGEVETQFRFHMEMSNLLAMRLRGMLEVLSPEARRRPGMGMLKQAVEYTLRID